MTMTRGRGRLELEVKVDFVKYSETCCVKRQAMGEMTINSNYTLHCLFSSCHFVSYEP